ncbi:MAG: hypothetical protein LAO03_04130 [Acidobacteriia bacterium]|nr:hypothetical protein [Terriglobia bacterium]
MRKLLALVCLVTLFSASSAAQTGKVDPIGPPSDASISDAVKKALDSKGYRVTLDDGTVTCEIWLRKSLPAQPKKDTEGAIYPLGESSLVGVISFPQATTDYRGQAIKPGTYTLRYEMIPNDGNHLGVAPNRDFLLLVPASSDADPDVVLKFQDLLDLSRKATGTRHPGPLSLVQAKSGTAASISKDEEDHWVFSAGLKTASGEDLPIALVVKGTAPQ